MKTFDLRFPALGKPMHTPIRILAIVAAILMITLVFQAPPARATNPPTPVDGNAALASGGATASASSQTTGYEASKAIDGSASTKWVSASGTPTFTATFPNKYYIVEIHVHMASVAQPDIDVYADADGTGTWSLVKSIRGNANVDLVATLGSTVAKQIRANFLTAVTHTHTWIHLHKYCDPETGVCEYYEHPHSSTETHPPQVVEFEAWGNLFDKDGDGLSTGYEEATVYRQDAIVDGVPLSIPNNGADILVMSLDRPRWAGIGTQAFLDLEVDHATPGDLVVAVGRWDGAAWQDRLAWVPGTYANASIWDTVAIQHTHTATETYCERHWHEEEGVFHCHTATRIITYDETHLYPGQAVPAAAGERMSFEVTSATTVPRSDLSGSAWRVTIDLTKAALEAWEADAGFRMTTFTAADLHASASWRILVRDWNPFAGAGTVRSAFLRMEERSDPENPDTDGDQVINDGAERGTGLQTFPVALDTDFDTLTDVFEKDPQSLTLMIDGATVVRTPKTSPTSADTDWDGLPDDEERSPGLDGVITDPANPKTDSDDLSDGDEFLTYGTDATRTDMDGDGFSDSAEVSLRSLSLTVDGVAGTRTITTLPYALDSDGDGWSDDDEWYGTTSAGVVTDPSDWDTDDDALGDGEEGWTVHAIPTLQALERVLESIEQRVSPAGWYTTYAVTSSPVVRDTEGDGLSDFQESLLHSNPRSWDTDVDRIPDSLDDDPTIVEIEKPLIYVDAIWCCDYPPGQLKRYWVTYSVRDPAYLYDVAVYKDGNHLSPVHYDYFGGFYSGVQLTRNFDVGWSDAFDGARWEIEARDANGNLGYITLQQPTLFNAVGNFLTSATVNGLGPQYGGLLSGGWYAFRDTVVDLATLFLEPQAIFDGGKAVADAFTSQGVEALATLAKALYEYIDDTQETANPYADGTLDHLTFRFNWYGGYIAATIGLSLVGATAARAIVQGLKASTVFAKISGALTDLADATKVAQWVNRLKGIGIVNSRILVAGVFTAAFAGLAYAFPEIFGEWFANYLGGAFVLMSVYNLGPGGFSQDALKATGRAIKDGVIDDATRMQGRFASYFDGVKKWYAVDPLDPAAGEHRLLFLVESPGVRVALPDRAILDTIVLKQGTGEWGWTHIWSDHADDFKKLLGANDPESIQRWIRNTVAAPDKFKVMYDNLGGVSEYRLARNIGTADRPVWIYVSVSANGSINTAFPTPDAAYIADRFS